MDNYFPISPDLFAKLHALWRMERRVENFALGEVAVTPFVYLQLDILFRTNDAFFVFVEPDSNTPGSFLIHDDGLTQMELGFRGVEFSDAEDSHYGHALGIVTKHGVMGFGERLVIANVAPENVSEAVLRLAACMGELNASLE